jgi:hypothetical protein
MAGGGNARRFTFPFGSSGSVLKCTNACGTMYDASFCFRNSRMPPKSSGLELARYATMADWPSLSVKMAG